MENRKVSEEELASVAECYFTAKGWDLYPEVVLDIMGGRADFIGQRNGFVYGGGMQAFSFLSSAKLWKRMGVAK